MAKNKNRDRSKGRNRGAAEQGDEQARPSSMDAPDEEMQSPMSPSGMTNKGRQRRFGHN